MRAGGRTCETMGQPNRNLARISHGKEVEVVSRLKPRKKTVVSIMRALRRPILSLRKPARGAQSRWASTQVLATQLPSSSLTEKLKFEFKPK